MDPVLPNLFNSKWKEYINLQISIHRRQNHRVTKVIENTKRTGKGEWHRSAYGVVVLGTDVSSVIPRSSLSLSSRLCREGHNPFIFEWIYLGSSETKYGRTDLDTILTCEYLRPLWLLHNRITSLRSFFPPPLSTTKFVGCCNVDYV